MSKQSVIVLGANGNTGSGITSALLTDPKFEVHIAVRPQSLTKPIVEEFKTKGATVHAVDVEKSTAAEIAEDFKGIDTVISCLLTIPFTNQNVLVDACKLAGVKRFVPSKWATSFKKGTIQIIGDQKFEVEEYIKATGVPYTLIDVGWWQQLTLPVLDPSKAVGAIAIMAGFLTTVFGTGQVKSAVTNADDIGKFVARIIADPRTLNRYVFIAGDEVTQNEVYAIAKEASGRDIPLTYKTLEDVERDALADPNENILAKIGRDYMKSMWIAGDNTTERAKTAEYGNALSARELYPDVKATSLKEWAQVYYADLK